MKIDMMNQGAGNESIAHENAITTNALKATHHKSPPIVCYAAGFSDGAEVESDIAYSEEIVPTLKTSHPMSTVYCIQGNCIDRADTAGCNGKGVRTEQTYTLNTVDRHAVAYRREGND